MPTVKPDRSLHTWLMAPAGPPIRYRTAIELVDAPSAFDTAQLTRDLLASSLVRTWLDRVQPPGGGLSHYHSSQPEAFENAASKLCDLGHRGRVGLAGGTGSTARPTGFRKGAAR